MGASRAPLGPAAGQGLALLRGLWAVDGLFLLLYIALGALVVLGLRPSVPDAFGIGQDGSFPEGFNYLKWLASALILAWAAWARRLFWPLALALCFLIVLADDAAQLHERLGQRLRPLMPPALQGPAPRELLSFGLIGLFQVLLLALAWRAKGGAEVRRLSPLLGLLVGFGVGVDALHSLLALGKTADGLWVLVEDGGEMIVASAILARVVQLCRPFPKASRRSPDRPSDSGIKASDIEKK